MVCTSKSSKSETVLSFKILGYMVYTSKEGEKRFLDSESRIVVRGKLISLTSPSVSEYIY